jgi:hypothetical protein
MNYSEQISYSGYTGSVNTYPNQNNQTLKCEEFEKCEECEKCDYRLCYNYKPYHLNVPYQNPNYYEEHSYNNWDDLDDCINYNEDKKKSSESSKSSYYRNYDYSSFYKITYDKKREKEEEDEVINNKNSSKKQNVKKNTFNKKK